MERGTVLLVEDDRTLAKMVRLELEAEGFAVETAGDGLDCLKKVRSRAPDAIVLDVMLPKFDGFKVCRVLKFDKHTRNIPIIIVSARNSEGDRAKGIAAGADHYLVKPFDEQDLLARIKELIGQTVSMGPPSIG